MNKRLVIVVLSVVIMILAIVLLVFGVYLNRISKPNFIFRGLIDNTSDIVNNYFYPDVEKLGNNFSISSNVKFNLDSQYYLKRSTTDVESLKKYNLITNLNKLDTTMNIKQDNKKKMLYMDFNEVLVNENLINAKFLVSDSTKYFLVKGIVNNYVNDGNCNYFETITDDNYLYNNIDYLYDFIIESLENNLDDEYFEVSNMNKNINDYSKDVYVVSLEIDNSMAKKILNRVLKDLKKDSKANQILSNTFSNFSEFKINNRIIKKGESYKINVYTSKYLYKPVGFEIIYQTKKDSYGLYYEGNNLEGDIHYYKNNEDIYLINYLSKDDRLELNINDRDGKKIGLFKMSKDNGNLSIDSSFDDGKKKFDFIYSSKNNDIDKKSFENDKKLTIKYIVNKESKLNGDVVVHSVIEKDVNINEDTSNFILYSNLSEEQKELLDNKLTLVKNRLEVK